MKKFAVCFFALFVIGIIALGGYFISGIGLPKYSDDCSKGVSVLKNYDNQSVEAIDKKVARVQLEKAQRRQEAIDGEQLRKAVEESIKRIDKNKLSYRAVFSNVTIAGDSLMNGLEAYDILNKSRLVTKVSASIYHLNDNISNIVSKHPQVLILHYGLNHIADSQQMANNFTSQYAKIIQKLKKALPDTRIIVSLIFPVDTNKATAKRFKYVSMYNKTLIKMCNEIGVEYLDSTSVFKGHKEFYGADGIHLSAAFYRNYWLKFIMRDKGIY